MSSAEHLREFIRERLTAAAAAEILTEVEKTIVRYEEELHALRRMMGINWKPEIKLRRIGLELQRQSSDLLKPHVSTEEEASPVQQLCNQGRWFGHLKKVESQLTDENQMEPEPAMFEELVEPGPSWIKKEEEPEPSLIDKEMGEPDFSVLKPEQQEPEHLPTAQNNKDLCSSQEVQQQFLVLIQTSALSPDVESKDQEGRSSIVSEGQSHSDTKKTFYTCDICGRSLKTKQILNVHKIIHTDAKPFSCETCGKSYKRHWDLKFHMRTHRGERPFSCQLCGKSFLRLQRLKRHSRIHSDLLKPHVSPKEKSAFQQLCDQGRRSGHQEKLQLTDENQMEPEPALFKELVEPGPSWIKKEEEPEPSLIKKEQQEPEHLPTAQNNKDLCSSQEVQQQFLVSIQTSAPQEGDLSEQQRTEQKGSSSIVSESPSHSDTKKTSFTCEICGKSLKTKKSLNVHKIIHTGDKPFSCETCGKYYKRHGDLNVHRRTHRGERRFSCQLCGKSFFRLNHLKSHNRVHTGERPFLCQLCGKSFARHQNLKCHYRLHTDESGFVCQICGKRFTRLQNLKCHNRRHTGER